MSSKTSEYFAVFNFLTVFVLAGCDFLFFVFMEAVRVELERTFHFWKIGKLKTCFLLGKK